MKRIALAAALLAATTLAQAETWRFLPGFKEANFKLQPTVALTGSFVNPDDDPTRHAYGVELNFNCGLVQTSENRIRTYAQINRSRKDGVTLYDFELSPRYMMPLSSGFYIGGGPSFTYLRAKADGERQSLYGLGGAVGLDYRIGNWYAGADVRLHNTFKRNGNDYDNTALGAKVGYSF